MAYTTNNIVTSSTPLILHRVWSNGQLIRCHPPMPMQFSCTHSYIQLIPNLYHHRYLLPLPQIRCLFINILYILYICVTIQVQYPWVNTSRLPLKPWTATLQTSCPRNARSERSPLSSWPQVHVPILAVTKSTRGQYIVGLQLRPKPCRCADYVYRGQPTWPVE